MLVNVLGFVNVLCAGLLAGEVFVIRYGVRAPVASLRMAELYSLWNRRGRENGRLDAITPLSAPSAPLKSRGTCVRLPSSN